MLTIFFSKEAVQDILTQAVENRLPKQLHVDFNWDFNPQNEAPSDDDVIDEPINDFNM